ncbi:helix-turn-helix domain-containing protein [Sphingobium sp. DEHP117]|uniref:helix-turn-helix domain-containing protein n=1 Tax=Sphingobium sp. DEHP117 TaxID=2993436 RepID=UPI0027D63902|nr:helix-turn-helix domain-containing protein [Sphingobium sp. DEHP117]MDQ4419839.1 helix-turn-helix domain-containing protein [Sphingobium sp. DEHP117]
MKSNKVKLDIPWDSIDKYQIYDITHRSILDEAVAMRPGERPEISRLPLFAEMREEERDRLFAASFLQVFPPELTLFEAGQQADFLHVLVDGLVELKAANHGRETSLTLVEPLHSFILAAVVTDMPYLMTARTLSASRILLVPAELVRGLIRQDKALMMAVIRELANGYREFVRALTDLKLRQSTERIGNHLLLQSRRRGGADNFQLKGEKKMLASLLGMTPENLSRGFGALAAEGVIISGSQVSITDRARLEAFSHPDPFYDPL